MAAAINTISDLMEKSSTISSSVCKFLHEKDVWDEKFAETKINIEHTNTQIASAQIALEIAKQNQINHQTQND